MILPFFTTSPNLLPIPFVVCDVAMNTIGIYSWAELSAMYDLLPPSPINVLNTKLYFSKDLRNSAMTPFLFPLTAKQDI